MIKSNCETVADRIQVTPKIISSIDGEITADNPNFEIKYRLGYKGMGSLGGVVDGRSQAWVDITPEQGLAIDIPANYNPSTYMVWITVEDKRNNTVASHTFDIQLSSTTYEGWLVLGNEGPEERVRLDMISVLSSTNIRAIYDVALGLPVIKKPTKFLIGRDGKIIGRYGGGGGSDADLDKKLAEVFGF